MVRLRVHRVPSLTREHCVEQQAASAPVLSPREASVHGREGLAVGRGRQQRSQRRVTVRVHTRRLVYNCFYRKR